MAAAGTVCVFHSVFTLQASIVLELVNTWVLQVLCVFHSVFTLQASIVLELVNTWQLQVQSVVFTHCSLCRLPLC